MSKASIDRPYIPAIARAEVQLQLAVYGLAIVSYVKLKQQEWSAYTAHLSSWERQNPLDC